MKLNPPQNGQSSMEAKGIGQQSNLKGSPANKAGTDNPALQATSVGSKALSGLKNTSAQVVKSEALSPQAAQQQLSALSRQLSKQLSNQLAGPLSTSQGKQDGDLSMQRQTSYLISQLQNGDRASQAQAKVYITQLNTQDTLFSVLTNKPYPTGARVQITQDASGQWQLQASKPMLQLEKWLSQFKGTSVANLNSLKLDKGQLPLPPSAPLASNTPQLGPQASKPLEQFLNSQQFQLISSEQKTQQLLQGIKSSGYALERQLLQWANTQLGQDSSRDPSVARNAPSEVSAPNLQRGLKHVQKQMQMWMQQAQHILNKPNHPPQGQAQATTQSASSTSHTSPAPAATKNEILITLTQLLQQDGKGQLLQHQTNLVKALASVIQQQPQLFNNSIIPNWSQANSDQGKLNLSDWINALVTPKTANHSQSIWPQNMSVQQQLQSTVQTMLAQLPNNASEEQALLRQLLNTSQNINKIQQDQIQSRVVQANSDNTFVQINLPYVHQNTLNWCDLEIEQQTEDGGQEHSGERAWHIVLRFQQSSPQSFAIEANVLKSKVDITLWSAHKDRLKTLQNQLAFLRDKMTQAGFQVQQLQTKHGEPAKKELTISQSLVDVHT